MKGVRDYKLEACVVNLDEAVQAQKRGADRVELCINLETGGMTPEFHLASSVINRLQIPVRVMIRENAEGFHAGGDVLGDMVRAINEFKHLSIEGYVFGVMKDKVVDREAMEVLIRHASPFRITFHKAIDESIQAEEDLSWLNQHASVDTVLTSGGAEKAIDGVPQILRMKGWFRGDIMPAGKITPVDLPQLHEQLSLPWYHGRAIVSQ